MTDKFKLNDFMYFVNALNHKHFECPTRSHDGRIILLDKIVFILFVEAVKHISKEILSNVFAFFK